MLHNAARPMPRDRSPLPLGRIAGLWWPLAASWLLMGTELPLFTAFVARLPEPEINLAAYGSLVFPISLLIEAPIIMLLAASTALASDAQAWRRVRTFMHWTSAALTTLHAAIAFTPLYDVLATDLLRVPAEVVEPARIGLRLMTPWTWSIAYRRAHQGLLIRFGRSRPIVFGTCVRLLAVLLVFAVGIAHGGFGGIEVGASAIAVGVVAEAVWIGWCARAVIREHLSRPSATAETLTLAAFLRFYVPLALTPFLAMAAQPLGAAAMSRMPESLVSLAAWPAVHGITFLARSTGFAFNEVVVSLIGIPGAAAPLARFGWLIGVASTLALAAVALTPLAELWFVGVSGLSTELGALAAGSLAWGLLLPLLLAQQSFHQGALVHAKRTRAATEAMAVGLLSIAAVLAIGIHAQSMRGLSVALVALSAGNLAQTAWLAWRSRGVLRALPGAA